MRAAAIALTVLALTFGGAISTASAGTSEDPEVGDSACDGYTGAPYDDVMLVPCSAWFSTVFSATDTASPVVVGIEINVNTYTDLDDRSPLSRLGASWSNGVCRQGFFFNDRRSLDGTDYVLFEECTGSPPRYYDLDPAAISIDGSRVTAHLAGSTIESLVMPLSDGASLERPTAFSEVTLGGSPTFEGRRIGPGRTFVIGADAPDGA